MSEKIKYTETYEYIIVDGGIGIVGISEEASGKLGDIYLIELPEIGKKLKKGEEAGVIESIKTASDVYSPVSGTVVEVNTKLESNPALVSHDPMKEGWLFKIEILDKDELDSLMDPNTFKIHINEVG